MARSTAVLRRDNAVAVLRPQAAYLLDGHQRQIDFEDGLAVDFERCSPVRQFPSWRGKRNYSGSYWSSTNGAHVGFESFYERTALMELDREASVIAISSQPMWITWPRGSEPRWHAPDFFVRHSNGEGEVVDVRPDKRIDDAAARSFEATRGLCVQAGFRYRVMSDLDQVLDQNLRLLLRYRDDRWMPPPVLLARLREYANETLQVRTLARVLAEGEEGPGQLGSVYWMIWTGAVSVDLRMPLSLDQRVLLSMPAQL